MTLKQKTLALLRDLRNETPAYYPVAHIAQKLGVEIIDIYDWNNDSGILYELEEEGLVDMVPRSETECSVVATGHMEWGW